MSDILLSKDDFIDLMTLGEDDFVREFVFGVDRIRNMSTLVVKNNTIVDMELYKLDNSTLNGYDYQILSTAFLMAQALKDSKVLFDARTKFVIPFEAFCALWGISWEKGEKRGSNLYRDVLKSTRRLNKRVYTYPNVDKSKMVESGYFSYIEYDNGCVAFGFPPPIIDYIKTDVGFTWYHLGSLTKLRSSDKIKVVDYAVALFEQIQKQKYNIQHSRNGEVKLKFKTDSLRKLLSVGEGNYPRHVDFRVKVIDKAVDHIFTSLGMKIEVDNIRVGNTKRAGVVGYMFTVTLDQRDIDFKKALYRDKARVPIMSFLQQARFAKSLVAHAEFSEKFRLEGEQDEDFVRRISEKLADNSYMVEIKDYLFAVGYTSSKFTKHIAMFTLDGGDSDGESDDEQGFIDDSDESVIEGEFRDVQNPEQLGESVQNDLPF